MKSFFKVVFCVVAVACIGYVAVSFFGGGKVDLGNIGNIGAQITSQSLSGKYEGGTGSIEFRSGHEVVVNMYGVIESAKYTFDGSEIRVTDELGTTIMLYDSAKDTVTFAGWTYERAE